MSVRWLSSLAAAGLLATADTAAAQSLRSDSPLWTYDGGVTELYPRNFFEDDTFGCEHALRTGVWRYVPADDPEWSDFWRLGNYGVIHCALLFGVVSDEADAATAFDDFAWMVRLGEAATEAGQSELWVLQIGVASGSRYELLKRQFGETGFDVLRAECPRGAERRKAHIDIWSQDVCVIRSRSEMTRIAIAASRKSPAGRLDFVSSEAQASDP